MNEYEQRFGGVERLIGSAAQSVLKKSHVCVIGIGGVGCWAVEALARSGIGELTLIDLDDLCITNTNRQIHALADTIGKAKVNVMRERVMAINPQCQIHAISGFFSTENAEQLFDVTFDYVIDAIDSVRNKCDLLILCKRRNIPVVTVGGAGGKIDASQIQLADLGRAHGDKLLSKVRSKLRKIDGFPNYADRKFGVECIFSPEAVAYPWRDGSTRTTPVHGESLRLDCASGFGTVSFITGIFGFMAAQRVVTGLIAETEKQ